MTAVGFMTEAQHREALINLARTWETSPEVPRGLRLLDLVCPGLLNDDRLPGLWDEFLGEVALLDGLNGLPWAPEAHWSDVNPELTGCDRTDAARDEMEMRVAGVLDALTRGVR